MNKLSRDIRLFLYGQHFADGLRVTVLIIVPAMIGSLCGYFDLGLTMSIGALCVSISDTPGPAYHKRNAMLVCCAFILAISLLTGFLRMNVYVMGAGLTFFAFFFAMLTMYGARASLIGTSILLLMVLEMDKALSPVEIVENSLLLTAGALWYSAISLLILWALPYRAAQRALGECISETAAYMLLRAQLYDNSTPLSEVFSRLIAQQVILNNKQNEVRDLLFKNKKIMRQASRNARAMVLTFDEVIDLYEKISASHIDYTAIRERYAHSGILTQISGTISRLAEMLDQSGATIQYNSPLQDKADITHIIQVLQDEIRNAMQEEENPILDNLLVNIESMYHVVAELQHYFSDDYAVLNSPNQSLQYDLFVSHQVLDLKLFQYNLTFDSLTFRHSVRMALACLTGFILSKSVMHGHHSYWLLIAIIFVLKPAFSLTKERNTQRILGTLIGGVIGVAILLFIHSSTVLFACMVIAMLFTYSFQRHKYLIAVVFMTPYLLILFHFMHIGLLEVAEERVVNTIIGSIIALIAGYLILPDWESDQIMANMKKMLQANYHYLLAIAEGLRGKNISVTAYKLTRKNVYVSASNLSAAVQRMKSEPSRTRKNTQEAERFSMLNHILTSQVAAVRESISFVSKEDEALIQSSLDRLDTAIKSMGGNTNTVAIAPEIAINKDEIPPSKDVFQAIDQTTMEIQTVTQAILA
jgi:uncharacterized membrane protein YccC